MFDSVRGEPFSYNSGEPCPTMNGINVERFPRWRIFNPLWAVPPESLRLCRRYFDWPDDFTI
jgi:hypothetical protein